MTNFYFEKRIETRRTFLQADLEGVSVKAIPRTKVLERWGQVGNPASETERIRRDHLFPSEKAANDYLKQLAGQLLSQGFRPYEGPNDNRLIEERERLYHEALKTVAQQLPESSEMHFSRAVDPLEWDILEDEFQLTLPTSYRTFVSRFNGGNAHWFDGRPGDTYFYSLAEARQRHQSFLERLGNAYRTFKCLPIGETPNSEVAVIQSSGPLREETSVLDAFHEEKPPQWGLLFPSFADFFICYVERRKEQSPVYTPFAYHWKPPQ